jgi:hypothetical protein
MSGANTLFFGDVRESKRDRSEHVAEKIIIARGMKTGRGSVSCSDFWDDDDIVSAQLRGLQINFLHAGPAMILTENPRKPQDDGFDFLERRLASNFRDVGNAYYNLEYASLADAEARIAAEKPIVIFVLGAKALQFMTDEKVGITDLNGTTAWDKNRQCWICWGISQASIFYNAESNRPLLEQAIDNFATSLKNISGLR